MGPEATIERNVREWARGQGIICLKFVSPGTSGVPDRIFIGPDGRVCFIEFKRPGAKPTALQRHWLNKLRDNEVPAAWFYNAEEAKEFLSEYML